MAFASDDTSDELTRIPWQSRMNFGWRPSCATAVAAVRRGALTFARRVTKREPASPARQSRAGIALRQPAAPTQVANCFHNQLELPILFYVLVAFILITVHRQPDVRDSPGLFVLSRLVHAYVHTGPNDVRSRSPWLRVGGIRSLPCGSLLHPHSDAMQPGARASRPRPKSSTTFSPGTGRRRRRWPIGARRIASPARATAPPSARSCSTPCAGASPSPRAWARTRRARWRSAPPPRLRYDARRGQRRGRRLGARRRSAERGREQPASARALPRRDRRCTSPATSPNG